ncbi:DUF4019 domain-containing protein [Sphingomonas piscis]|uniref:DUF4019 domain-containing protein n=1 Tax=Sphingomonas piscis TaxID=2714943 RepID=A0A6G7YMB4_9SPHN|nr:DUF4019 domain-containing protein [Sphingomonas piscis]QIK77883.1 DUF4019 domain-containing protein [Sphingomonas piscis]
MLAILLSAALAGAAPVNQEPNLAAAKSWISLVDSKRWDDSWTAAGTLFKSQMPQARWVATIAPVREPLGPVSSRALKSVTKAKSLPGAPDGEYEIVQFDTNFANKAAATETVVLSHETSGWKVDGYFIK